jgi:hypothetical protein
MSLARMGFIGTCSVGESGALPCTNMSSGMETSPSFYDHSMGLHETTLGHKTHRFRPGISKATVSGPIVDTNGYIPVSPIVESIQVGVSSRDATTFNITFVSGDVINATGTQIPIACYKV